VTATAARVGLVCPYSFDVPGGVQNHVRDLAEALRLRGFEVSVLAPGDPDADHPEGVVTVGSAVPVPANGSVARLAFGPLVGTRVRRWLRTGFDLVHVHEPAAPSLSLLTVWAAEVPMVGTFHTSRVRTRALAAGVALVRPALEKLNARIAVSSAARETLVELYGGDPVVIPNGVWVDRFARARSRPEWAGQGTVAFVGRLDEPRKGFAVLAAALPGVVRARPGVRVLVVGTGDAAAAVDGLPAEVAERVTFLGGVDDTTKAEALATADVLVAPNTYGESFGIVLVEAMAAGAAVVASDLPAFEAVLRDGRCGRLVPTGDGEGLAEAVVALLDDDAARASLRRRGAEAARAYDWPAVSARVEQVYEAVLNADAGPVAPRSASRRREYRWSVDR
jgi:phosphatidylinositol alpha-mannosyltransferase